MKTVDVLICITIGNIAGMFNMGFIMDNSNRDFTPLQQDLTKAQEICESFGSNAAWIDLDDEVVCANGAVVNYEEFGE